MKEKLKVWFRYRLNNNSVLPDKFKYAPLTSSHYVRQSAWPEYMTRIYRQSTQAWKEVGASLLTNPENLVPKHLIPSPQLWVLLADLFHSLE